MLDCRPLVIQIQIAHDCAKIFLHPTHAAPAVEFANKLAASGSKNPVMVLKGTICAIT